MSTLFLSDKLVRFLASKSSGSSEYGGGGINAANAIGEFSATICGNSGEILEEGVIGGADGVGGVNGYTGPSESSWSAEIVGNTVGLPPDVTEKTVGWIVYCVDIRLTVVGLASGGTAGGFPWVGCISDEGTTTILCLGLTAGVTVQ